MVYGCTRERVSIDGEYSGKIFDTDLSVVPGDLYTMALTRARVTCRRYRNCDGIGDSWASPKSGIKNRTNGFLVRFRVGRPLCGLNGMRFVADFQQSSALLAVGHLKSVKYSVDVPNLGEGN